MKKIFYVVAALFLVACHGNSHHDASGNTAGLSLNNGQKWEVNAEMRPHIEQGNEILNSYTASGGSDYQTLAKQLKEQNGKLINSCTMNGPAHDELHKWLHPHIELIDELDDADNAAAANDIIAKLEASFQDYSKYFN